MNLNLQWVDSPRTEWIEDIESMADGYPFEKRRNELRDEDLAARCRSTWKNGTPSGKFLAAFFEAKLVGWIRVRESPFPSDRLQGSYKTADWELIQRNRDDIRERLFQEIVREYPESVIGFSQPSQNRTARNFYLGQEEVVEGPVDLLLGRRLNTDASPASIPEMPSEMSPASATSILANFPADRLGGFLTPRTILPEDRFTSLATEKVRTYLESESRGGLSIESGKDSNQFLLYDHETTTGDALTSTGRLPFVGFQAGAENEKLLDAVLEKFRSLAIEYVEARLDESNELAHRTLLETGFKPLTKRMYFFRVPSDANFTHG